MFLSAAALPAGIMGVLCVSALVCVFHCISGKDMEGHAGAGGVRLGIVQFQS